LSSKGGEAVDERLFKKTRADDFKAEIDHLADFMSGKVAHSPLELGRGLDTLMVIAASFKSNATGRRVRIDWSRGYCSEALL
jgi:hypothetical protein